jgi:hypothetical protein
VARVLNFITLFIFTILLTGCAIHQKVKPVSAFDEKQICIIEKPEVKEGFLNTYIKVLSEKGYAVKKLPASASIIDCPITSTYNARWQWDMALYMALAEIAVYKNGANIGEASYDSLNGSGNMGKFVNAEKKITELVNQLFPQDKMY